MSENKRVTIPFLEKVLKPIVDLVHTKADKKDVYVKTELANVAVSGSYTDLTNTPTLATVATSGSYADLSDVPVPDATLSVEGSAADAKAVGDAITEAIIAITSEEIEEICGTLEGGVEVPEGIVAFADQVTGKTHSVYVSDGKLYMAEAE